MKIYKGKLRDGGVGGQKIMVQQTNNKYQDYPLRHIESHSPDGFNWGYGGSGPADTALSILTDCLGEAKAQKLYQYFKFDFVAGWGDKFSISEQTIKDWARRERAKLEL